MGTEDRRRRHAARRATALVATARMTEIQQALEQFVRERNEATRPTRGQQAPVRDRTPPVDHEFDAD